MTRFLGVVLVACACHLAPRRAPLAPSSVVDERVELLGLFASAGLPSVLGWSRVEQILRVESMDGKQRCRRVWVRQEGVHRLVIDDDLDIDYGGSWFAQWPVHMRVPAESYEQVVMPFRQVRVGRSPRQTVLAERPSDLLTEEVAPLRRSEDCPPMPTESPVVTALARASWVRELGHEPLARAMVARWPTGWTDARVRDELARTLVRVAFDGLAQGMPRGRVRPLFEQAQRLGPGESSDYAAACVAVLGTDVTAQYDADDPESMLAWLADDLVFPELHYRPIRLRDRVGWAPEQMPRSPALDLVLRGWSTLPLLIESEPSARLMRRTSPTIDRFGRRLPYTTSAVIGQVVSAIAMRKFASDEHMRTWWRNAKGRNESDVLIEHLVDGHADGLVVPRLLKHEPRRAIERLDVVWPDLDATTRADVMAELVDAIWPEEGRALVAAAEVADLRRLLWRAATDESLPVVAHGVAGLRHAGERTWLADAIARARVPLPDRTGHTEDIAMAREDLLVTIARADARRGAALLREILRRERGEPGGVVDEVLFTLCDASDHEPIPDCRPPLRQMFGARARLLDDDPT